MTGPDTPLSEEDLDPDPIRQFERWFEDATRAGAFEPELVGAFSARRFAEGRAANGAGY